MQKPSEETPDSKDGIDVLFDEAFALPDEEDGVDHREYEDCDDLGDYDHL